MKWVYSCAQVAATCVCKVTCPKSGYISFLALPFNYVLDFLYSCFQSLVVRFSTEITKFEYIRWAVASIKLYGVSDVETSAIEACAWQ